jgi:DNA topoisomerase-1
VAKNLVIVESPAKAKTIERYLGKNFRVRASMGHVRDLPRSKLGVDIKKDFRPTYTLLPGKKKAIAALAKAAAGADTIYMATDLDREGEAIAWHLCEALGLDPKEVKRVVFSEITRPAIQEAFAQPGSIDMDKVSAQETRRILDRLVGYKLSPLLWKKVAKGLSAGRVQSVAVRLIVEREREIRAFKPEEFWRITAHLRRRGEKQVFTALLAEVDGAKFRPHTGADAKQVGAALRQAAYGVLTVKKRRVEDRPRPPFITSELQRAASTELGFSAKKTMMLAQRLYQGVELGPEGSLALITYMRTDSHHVAPTAQAAARDFVQQQFGAQYLPDQTPVYRSKGRAQAAHEAIRPTDVARTPESVRGFLDRDEARLYELVWKRFVASQMKPAEWDVTEAEIEATGGERRGLFKARGRVLAYDGHTRVSGVRLGKDEQELPRLAQGEALDLANLEETQHFTQPPARYSEATLVRELEKQGIGRPSTYAPIITTIQDRGYVTQVKRQFHATELGEVVTDKLVEHFPKIMDVKFTGHMEDELDDVEESRIDWLSVIREFWEPFSEALEKASEEMTSAKNDVHEEAGPCPECGKPLLKRLSKRGSFLGCSGYPDCKFTRPLDENGQPKPEAKATEHKCEKCGGRMMLRTNKRGEPFLGCENYPKCRSTLPCDAEGNPVKPEPTGQSCEKCGADMVVKRGRRGPFLACSAYPKCRNAKPLPGQEGSKAPGKRASAAGEDDRGQRGAARKTARPKAEPTDQTCPDCGQPMLIRSGRRGRFLGCSGYPKCRHTENLPDNLK